MIRESLLTDSGKGLRRFVLAAEIIVAAILRGLLDLRARAAAFSVLATFPRAACSCGLVFPATVLGAAIFAAGGCLVLAVLHAGHGIFATRLRVLAGAARHFLAVGGFHVGMGAAGGRIFRVG